MKKRSGRTKTFSISVDDRTRQLLRAEAARRFDGNVSALIADLARELERRQAMERLLGMLGAEPLTDERRAEIDAEFGWGPPQPKRRSRRKKAA